MGCVPSCQKIQYVSSSLNRLKFCLLHPELKDWITQLKQTHWHFSLHIYIKGPICLLNLDLAVSGPALQLHLNTLTHLLAKHSAYASHFWTITNASKVLPSGGADCFFLSLRGRAVCIHSDFQQDFRAHRESSKLLKMPHKKRSHAHHKHSKEEKEVSFPLECMSGMNRCYSFKSRWQKQMICNHGFTWNSNFRTNKRSRFCLLLLK